jgi:hypothetical protein
MCLPCILRLRATSQGETVLHRAAEQGSVTIVRQLLALRVDVDVFDRKDLTPLHRCVGHADVARALLAAGANAGLHRGEVRVKRPCAAIGLRRASQDDPALIAHMRGHELLDNDDDDVFCALVDALPRDYVRGRSERSARSCAPSALRSSRPARVALCSSRGAGGSRVRQSRVCSGCARGAWM